MKLENIKEIELSNEVMGNKVVGYIDSNVAYTDVYVKGLGIVTIEENISSMGKESKIMKTCRTILSNIKIENGLDYMKNIKENATVKDLFTEGYGYEVLIKHEILNK